MFNEAASTVANQYLVLSNLGKVHNLGTILRSASAFKVKLVCVVGRTKFHVHGAHGANKHVKIRHFYSFQEAKTFLVSEENCHEFIGVQSNALSNKNSSIAVDQLEFKQSVAFVIPNEKSANGDLMPEQEAICTSFCYVPTITTTTNLRLEITVLASVVLHTFASWAPSYETTAIESTETRGKFNVQPVTWKVDEKLAAAREANRDATTAAETLSDEINLLWDY